MRDEVKQLDDEENAILVAAGNNAATLNVTTIALIVWAVVITLAIAAIGTLVFRRLRKKQSDWPTNGSVASDAESGATSSGMSDASSVVDFPGGDDASASAEGGAWNGAFEADYGSGEVAGTAAEVHCGGSMPDLNKQEDLDFDSIGGLYEDEGESEAGPSTAAEDPKNLASTRQAFGSKMHKGAGSINKKPLQNLFLPDSGSSFM